MTNYSDHSINLAEDEQKIVLWGLNSPSAHYSHMDETWRTKLKTKDLRNERTRMAADLPYIDQGKACACALGLRRAASGSGRYALWEIESPSCPAPAR